MLMMKSARRPSFPTLLVVLAVAFGGQTYAGPPFLTDDPEPVELHHCEFYIATQQNHSADGWSGTAPHLELNYGAAPDLQLHMIAPFAYDSPSDGRSHHGYADTELGFKYRFVHETNSCPQIGIFPLVELPTGNSSKGLGSGETQVFVPVWLQKEFGDWTTYGGGGYWFNPGEGNRNHWFGGWEVQRKICESFTAGLEIQYNTADTIGGHSSTALNAGGIWDISDTYHVLFSAGHTVHGRSEFQGYAALQITFGPEEANAPARK